MTTIAQWELIDKGVALVRGGGGYFTARVNRQGDWNVLWVNGAPVAECRTAAECRRLLSAILLVTGADPELEAA